MICTVLKGFALSRDGMTGEWVRQGDRVDIPNHLVPGLVRERFIGEAADIQAATPENKAIQRAEEVQAGGALPENKGDDLPALRAEYQRVVGRRPFMGWDADMLRAKIEGIGE